MKNLPTKRFLLRLMVMCFCFFWGFGYDLPLIAQDEIVDEGQLVTVYPVRKNHKWGYYRYLSDTLIEERPPIYDAISSFFLDWNTLDEEKGQSPFKIYEADGKVGLLDNLFRPVLDNEFKRIRPLSTNFFAVEPDSLFTLATRAESTSKPIILWPDKRYNNIIQIPNVNDFGGNYFLIKEGGNWGIAKEDGTVIIKPKFAETKPTDREGYFKVREEVDNWGWGLISPVDTLILKFKYKEIFVLDDNTFAALPMGTNSNQQSWRIIVVDRIEGNKYDLIDEELSLIEGFMPATVVKKDYSTNISFKEYKSVKYLNSTYALIKYKERVRDTTDVLYHIATNSEITPQDSFKTYEPLDDKHIIGLTARESERGNEIPQRALLDLSLRVLLKPGNYQSIKPSGIDGLFFVRKEGKWGLISTINTVKKVIDYQYDWVSSFKNGIAKCFVSVSDELNAVGGFGAVSYMNNTLDSIHCQFDSISIRGRNLTTFDFSNDEDIIWRLTKKGKFKRQKQYNDVIADEYNENDGFLEVGGELVKTQLSKKRFPLIIQAGKANYFFQQNTVTQEGYQKIKTNYFGTNVVIDALEVDSPMVALYHDEIKSNNNQLCIELLRAKAHMITLFDTQEDQPAKKEKIMGFRRFGTNQKYTAFIDEDGKMGLIDRSGKELKKANGSSIRYTYIGPFVGGFARVCKGGMLKRKLPTDLPIIDGNLVVQSYNDFLRDFNMRPETNNSKFRREEKGTSNLRVYCFEDGSQAIRWGYIDENGNEIVPPQYDFVKDYSVPDQLGLILKKREPEKGITLAHNVYFGALDMDGKLILDTKYKRIGRFKDYIVVQRDGTPTFLYDNKGRQLLTNPTKTRSYSEGFAHMRGENGKWGFVDTLGRMTIPAAYDTVRAFSNGLALVIAGDKCGFIDKEGNMKIPVNVDVSKWWRYVDVFKEELCPIRKGSKWGYLNKDGDVAIPFRFRSVRAFNNGVALVVGLKDGKFKQGLINTEGNWVIDPGTYANIYTFNQNGIAAFKSNEGKFGYLNKQSEVIVKAEYEMVDSVFYNGYGRVKSINGQWGLVDETGKLAMKPSFDILNLPSEDMVAVKKYDRDRYFRIFDIQKQKLLKTEYLEVGSFSKGIALVTDKDGNKVLIEKDGTIIKQNRGTPKFVSEGLIGMKESREYYADRYGENLFVQDFTEIEPHEFGVAKIKVGRNRFMAINKRGIQIVPPKYPKLFVIKHGFIRVNPNHYYGLMNLKGEEIIPPDYDRIIAIKAPNGNYNGLYRVERGEEVGYLRLDGDKLTEVWPLTK